MSMPAKADLDANLDPSTKIEQVVANRAAVMALKKRGIHTVGDLQGSAEAKTLPELPADAIVPETDANIVLRSDKFPGLILRLLKGEAQVNPVTKTMLVLQPVAVEFRGGAGILERRKWLLTKHNRDEAAVARELAKPAKEAPWRNEAIKWLRSRMAYTRGDFKIVE